MLTFLVPIEKHHPECLCAVDCAACRECAFPQKKSGNTQHVAGIVDMCVCLCVCVGRAALEMWMGMRVPV